MRPTHIADPSCSGGGYCEWVERADEYARVEPQTKREYARLAAHVTAARDSLHDRLPKGSIVSLSDALMLVLIDEIETIRHRLASIDQAIEDMRDMQERGRR